MYKNLYLQNVGLTPQLSEDTFYTLEELFDYTTTTLTDNFFDGSVSPRNEVFVDAYIKNINHLRNVGMPSKHNEQFNNANLNKLLDFNILINNNFNKMLNYVDDDVSSISYQSNRLVFSDGAVYTSNDIREKKPFNVQVLDFIHSNKSRQQEYIKFIQHTDNFSNLTFAFSPFTNIVTIPTGSNDKFYKNPLSIEYRNITEEPYLECNTSIIDIQHNLKVKINESVKATSGQMNFTTYVLRENSELILTRKSTDLGGWNIFDSVFICHPNSKLTIDTENNGSSYTQENFYINSSFKNVVKLKGRNNILTGNNFHQYVHQTSNDNDNYSSIDIKNVGHTYANTSFVGRYDIGAMSRNFDGNMSNQNLMLDKETKMHTRPILDIKTKEIKCQHGCTISNINEEQKYYLNTRGIEKPEQILIKSFLC